MNADPIGAILDGTLDKETGIYTDAPGDSGGPTKWGITLATLSEYNGSPATIAEVQALTRNDAFAILHQRYVDRPHFGLVAEISMTIAARLIDGGVLCGPAVLSIMLQRCLNALNLNGTKYADVAANGEISPGSLAALRAFLAWRGKEGERVLLEAIECLLGARFIADAERRPKDEQWLYGWISKRITVTT